jgi:hypothetical protein
VFVLPGIPSGLARQPVHFLEQIFSDIQYEVRVLSPFASDFPDIINKNNHLRLQPLWDPTVNFVAEYGQDLFLLGLRSSIVSTGSIY